MTNEPTGGTVLDVEFGTLLLEEPTFQCECVDDISDPYFHAVVGSPIVEEGDPLLKRCESEAVWIAMLTFTYPTGTPFTAPYYFCDACFSNWEEQASHVERL